MALPNAHECESAWHVPARLRLELLALLSADWLWRQPLPDPMQVLLEIDRDAYRRYLHNRIQQAGS
jgi:hypothetical protein